MLLQVHSLEFPAMKPVLISLPIFFRFEECHLESEQDLNLKDIASKTSKTNMEPETFSLEGFYFVEI